MAVDESRSNAGGERGPSGTRPKWPETGTAFAWPVLMAILLAYALLLAAFFVPAHPGVDQNGYMTTGRELATHARLYFVPRNPYQFVGAMMVQTPAGKIFAKYPPGVGILAALAWFIGGPRAIYIVDPACAIIGLAAAFFLYRRFVSHFLALIGVLLLAVNPVILQFADDANSHGAAFGFTLVGFSLLVIWWECGGFWRGIAAGFFLGACASMRYTEILWCIPLAGVLLLARFDARRRWRDVLPVAGAFALPVLVLCMINWASFGAPWRTGYWFCGEQSGFGWRYLLAGDHTHFDDQGNWITALGQFENMGLFLILPLTITGLGALLAEKPKWGMFFAAWIIPSTTVYLFYYWAPDRLDTVGYLRFFIDVIPAMLLVALWCLETIFRGKPFTGALVVGLLAALAGAYGLVMAVPAMEQARQSKWGLLAAARALQAHGERGSIVFAEMPECDYLNSIGGYQLYNLQLFTPQFFQRCVKLQSSSGPHPLQAARVAEYLRLFGKPTVRGQHGRRQPLSLAGFHAIELRIIRRAFTAGREVFYIVPRRLKWPTVPSEKGIRSEEVAQWQDVILQSQRGRAGFGKHRKASARTIAMALYRIVPAVIQPAASPALTTAADAKAAPRALRPRP